MHFFILCSLCEAMIYLLILKTMIAHHSLLFLQSYSVPMVMVMVTTFSRSSPSMCSWRSVKWNTISSSTNQRNLIRLHPMYECELKFLGWNHVWCILHQFTFIPTPMWNWNKPRDFYISSLTFNWYDSKSNSFSHANEFIWKFFCVMRNA